METVTHVSNNIYGWFKKTQDANYIKQLSENQILNIANDINSLFSETNLIESKPELTLPRLVVVGTQSSGKSSVLNGIISMDILPTGKNMVTRTPLNLHLHKIGSEFSDGWIEFGIYNGEGWTVEYKIPIDVPVPTVEQVKKIRIYIAKKTIEIAGDGMNISKEPIILKIYSPYVPNLSLIDLPGLTMVAQIDKGQPADIKDRINQLVSSYIKHPRTIILAVMQARTDLETDLGLALIKKYDNDGQRTIGILTKPDLMNSEEHIGSYLTNTVSKSLMLSYGYYVVKNRNGIETSNTNMFGGYELEREYFLGHNEYNKSIYKERIGMTNLINNLSKILIVSVSDMIPSVIAEIVSLETKVNTKLETLGEKIPDTKEGKIALLNKYVSNFNSRFIDSIESRGTFLNGGKKIKDIFVNYRSVLNNINPFANSNTYNETYFKDIISSFDGNHMSFHIPPVQILEACMTDERYRPIMHLREPSDTCINNTCETVVNLLRDIEKHDEFSQYPTLANYITSVIIEHIIAELKIKTKQQVSELLKNEEAYIWTDSKTFKETLVKTTIVSLKNDGVKVLLESYFNSVKYVVAHAVPKIIMGNVIREIEKNMLPFLIQNVVSEDKINLLKEGDEVEKQRQYYTDLRNKINTIKNNFRVNKINAHG